MNKDEIERAIEFIEDLAESCAPKWRSAEGKHVGDDLSAGEIHLYTAITALQAQIPKTKFDAWKQGLTLEELRRGDYIRVHCMICPANFICDLTTGKTCVKNFKDWGEADADND